MPCPCVKKLPPRVRGVVSLCHWYETLLFGHFWRCRRIPVHRCPCIDHYGTLSLTAIHRALDFIKERVKVDGDVVAVHCKDGRGRSAVVAACWMIREDLVSAGYARRHLNEQRPQTSLSGTRWETVCAFEKSV
jgi:atypical dual specificity phosphatase